MKTITKHVAATSKTMQTSTVLSPGAQPVGALPMQNVVIMPQYVTAPPPSTIWATYASKWASALGATQIVIGILCIVSNVVAMGAGSPVATIGHGIWGGCFVSDSPHQNVVRVEFL